MITVMMMMMMTVSSCRDDLFDDVSAYGSGKSEVSAEIDFSEIVHPVSGSRAAGDAISDINSLVVFLYRFEPGAGQDGADQYTLVRRENVDITKVEGASTSTVKFKLSGIDFGNYRIYGVANMPDLADDEKYPDQEILTPDDLRDVSLTWDETSAGANNQMFGYFTTLDNQHSDGLEGDPIDIRSLKVSLHAYLKRAASKVTVAIDGSGLNPGVKVWIKSIQVRDIPRVCFLGRDNSADRATLISRGEKITLAENLESADDDDAPNLVTRDANYPRDIEEAHEPDAPALFFYENLQGEGQLKSQVWPEQGPDPTEPMYPYGNLYGNPGYKDSKLYGTYVEVVGFYENGTGSGPIVYRFMLGENTTTNYDVRRNHHFQLTLKLKNDANNNDWHIVYDQEPQLLAITPGYVSYLYNTPTTYTFNIVGGELIDLTAEIPDNDINKVSWRPKDGEVTAEDEAAEASVGGSVYWQGPVNDPGPWNGFLSLRKPNGLTYGTVEDGYIGTNAATYTLNKKVFYGLATSAKDASIGSYDPQDDQVYNHGFRRYDVSPGVHPDEGGEYEVTQSSPTEWEIKVPFYTRQLIMTAQTGYTGVNPYIAYQRLEEVVFTAKIRRRNGEIVTISKTIDVIQSRRVVNPKAIWRKADSTSPFRVQLKILPSQTSHTFQNLPSDGPWRAEVVQGNGWIELVPTAGVSKVNADGSISGVGNPYDPENPGKFIDFTVKPTGTTSTPRGGIIYVHYNNYSCTHSIFVRQGYDPVEFYGTGVMWHSFNLLSGGYDDTPALEVDGPEEEGSYFRLHNRKYPINAVSCTAPDPFKIVDRDGDLFAITGPDGNVSEHLIWQHITLDPIPDEWGTFKVKLNGEEKECRMPTSDDWHKIINNPSTTYGYGVLYADCATETADDVNLVYGITDHAHGGHGMRGTVVCDATTGTQMFLPIASCGYGRFKQNSRSGQSNFLPPWMLGVVQYAGRYAWFNSEAGYGITYKPLFYDLFQANGAIYWIAGNYGLDINYSTLDFAIGKQTDLGVVVQKDPDPTGSDAIHIRLVHDK